MIWFRGLAACIVGVGAICLALACGGIPDPKGLARDTPISVKAEPQTPQTKNAPTEEQDLIARYSRELSGSFGWRSSTLTMNSDGTFSVVGADPCGEKDYSGRWTVTRVNGSFVNATLDSQTTGELIIIAGKDQEGSISKGFGMDCVADMGEQEAKTYWAAK